MKHTHHKPVRWFENPSRRHATFFIAIGLIGVLFVAALVGILSGRYKPFADLVTPGESTKLKNSLTLKGGTTTYTAPDGSTVTINGSPAPVVVNALTKATLTLQGASNRHDHISHLDGKLSLTLGDAPVSDPTSLRNIVWSTTDRSTTAINLGVNSASLREYADSKTAGTTFGVVLKPNFYLAKRINGVTNLRNLGTISFKAGDINNDNTVNIQDFAKLVAKYNQSVDADSEFDVNKDGTVNISDFAIMVANYNQTGDEF